MTKVIIFISLMCLSFNSILTAQKTTWVKVSSSCLAVQITPDEAKQKALELARAEAIKQAVGLKITEETFRGVTEALKNGEVSEFRDVFNRFNLSSSFGKIIEEEKRYTVEMDGEYPRYICHLRAKVVEEHGAPDPNFKAEIVLDRNSFLDRGTSKREEVKFKLWASQNCYLYLFNIMSVDSVQLILPNKHISNTYFDRNKTEQDFEKQIISWGLKFWAGLSPGKSHAVEGLLLIALKEKVEFNSPNFSPDGSNIIPTYRAAITDIMSWLVAIPLDKRAEAFATFEIRKAR